MLLQCVLPFNYYYFFNLKKKKPRGLDSPIFYLDISKVKSAMPGVRSYRQPVALAHRKGQSDAAGTRRHLSNNKRQ